MTDASDQDALATARELLGGVDDLVIDERPAVLENVHGILAAELAALDEV
ncbi:MAG: hypothetical protein KY469_07500 [Actinobacteria bacterium]|nr:hypothetical protein [Actinomycetota bacterium]